MRNYRLERNVMLFRNVSRLAAGILALGAASTAAGCIFKERTVEIVIGEDLCTSRHESRSSSQFSSEYFLDCASEWDRILEDNGLTRSDILRAHLVGAEYCITGFSQERDWSVDVSIWVERIDVPSAPEKLSSFDLHSLSDTEGEQRSLQLEASGVAQLDRAFEDYLAGEYPKLVFLFSCSVDEPHPSESDPIVFEWRTCFSLQAVAALEVEMPVLF